MLTSILLIVNRTLPMVKDKINFGVLNTIIIRSFFVFFSKYLI